MSDIPITELLLHDSRPTFIIDFQSSKPVDESHMNVVFTNEAFRFFDDLRKVIMADTFYPNSITPPPSSRSSASPVPDVAALELEFREWATEACETPGYLPRHTFRQMLWTSTMLKGRWRVISASQVPHQQRQSHGTPRSGGTSRSSSLSRISEDVTDPNTLKNQLADSMSKFKVLTELNPIGIYYLSPDGDILYCNNSCKYSRSRV